MENFGMLYVMDVHTRALRSYNMSRIRNKDTKPEILVRRILFSRGFRYRLHVSHLPGKPDIVLPKYKTAIFVHGCFWHGHKGCKYFKIPETRKEWWLRKISKTKTLDEKNKKALVSGAWNVIEIWECQLRPANIDKCVDFIMSHLT